jgi:hypothetical protein
VVSAGLFRSLGTAVYDRAAATLAGLIDAGEGKMK